MSQTAASPLDPESASLGTDSDVHGPGCYDADGKLTCAWPERHDGTFVEVLPPPPDRPVVKARSIGRLIDRLLTSLIVALGVVAVGIGILVLVANLHFQTVTSGSMRPTISPGDVAVTQAVPVSSLKVGDVIVFYPRASRASRSCTGSCPWRTAQSRRVAMPTTWMTLAGHAHRHDRLPDGGRRALPWLVDRAAAPGAHSRRFARGPRDPARTAKGGEG